MTLTLRSNTLAAAGLMPTKSKTPTAIVTCAAPASVLSAVTRRSWSGTRCSSARGVINVYTSVAAVAGNHCSSPNQMMVPRISGSVSIATSPAATCAPFTARAKTVNIYARRASMRRKKKMDFTTAREPHLKTKHVSHKCSRFLPAP